MQDEAKFRKPFLTDRYDLAPTVNGGQPVDMAAVLAQTNPAFINTDAYQNIGNIRFRHNKDRQANVLMVDGHAQTFNFNKSTMKTDLLRKNIFVNP